MITIENINPKLNKSIEIDAKRQLGITATVWAQEHAREIDEYDLPIDNWQIGKDRDGNEIQINTLGRFLFGVPGYDGHVRIVSEDTRLIIHYPSEPSESETLFSKLKENVEQHQEVEREEKRRIGGQILKNRVDDKKPVENTEREEV